MSSTNKTTNYELSQYIGTDKPTYLGDYNGDMLKIDTAMKTNNTLAETASGKADTALTNAGTAQTTAETAQTTAETAQTTANSASTTATSALTKANANESNISSIRDIASSETLIGTYKGRNLYRKVVTFNSTLPVGDTNVSHGISNLDYAIKAELITSESYMFPYMDAQGKIVILDTVDTTNCIIRNFTSSAWSQTARNFDIIIEYLKTGE